MKWKCEVPLGGKAHQPLGFTLNLSGNILAVASCPIRGIESTVACFVSISCFFSGVAAEGDPTSAIVGVDVGQAKVWFFFVLPLKAFRTSDRWHGQRS